LIGARDTAGVPVLAGVAGVGGGVGTLAVIAGDVDAGAGLAVGPGRAGVL